MQVIISIRHLSNHNAMAFVLLFQLNFTFCSPRHLNSKTELSWEHLNNEYRE